MSSEEWKHSLREQDLHASEQQTDGILFDTVLEDSVFQVS